MEALTLLSLYYYDVCVILLLELGQVLFPSRPARNTHEHLLSLQLLYEGPL